MIRARFPWHSRLQTRVMIEITMDEDVLLPAEWRQVIHNYDEPLNAQVQVLLSVWTAVTGVKVCARPPPIPPAVPVAWTDLSSAM